MAKARHNYRMDISERDFWKSLFNNLKSAVVSNVIACPESEFHHEESGLNRKTEAAIMRTASELSLGLEFRLWDNILDSLIEEAAYKFLGKTPPPSSTWAIAFTSDPRAPVESRLEKMLGSKVRVDVSFSLPNEIIERRRQSKKDWVIEAQRALERNAGDSWADELLIQKRAFVYVLYGPPAFLLLLKEFSGGTEYDKLNASAKFSNLYNNFYRLTSIGIKDFAFFHSDEIFNIPFIDIFCSLNAAYNFYHHERRPHGSDLNDYAILAITLPYCDVVTTDKFMKELLVNLLHFDKKYECQIFSGSEEDRQALQEFIKRIN
jgi:hypothetical protein